MCKHGNLNLVPGSYDNKRKPITKVILWLRRHTALPDLHRHTAACVPTLTLPDLHRHMAAHVWHTHTLCTSCSHRVISINLFKKNPQHFSVLARRGPHFNTGDPVLWATSTWGRKGEMMDLLQRQFHVYATFLKKILQIVALWLTLLTNYSHSFPKEALIRVSNAVRST